LTSYRIKPHFHLSYPRTCADPKNQSRWKLPLQETHYLSRHQRIHIQTWPMPHPNLKTEINGYHSAHAQEERGYPKISPSHPLPQLPSKHESETRQYNSHPTVTLSHHRHPPPSSASKLKQKPMAPKTSPHPN